MFLGAGADQLVDRCTLTDRGMISALKDMEYNDRGIHKKNNSKSLIVLIFEHKDKSFI